MSVVHPDDVPALIEFLLEDLREATRLIGDMRRCLEDVPPFVFDTVTEMDTQSNLLRRASQWKEASGYG